MWSLVVFDLDYDPIQNNIVTVFNERFFEVQSMEWRFGFLAHFVAYCESCAHDRKTVILEIKVSSYFCERKTVLPHFVFFPENSEIPATPWT